MQERRVDLLILGDGIVARALAKGAASLGITSARIGAAERYHEDDPRSYAIAPSSLAFLNAIGAEFQSDDADDVTGISLAFANRFDHADLEIAARDAPLMTMIDHKTIAKALEGGTQIEGEAGALRFADDEVIAENHGLRAKLLVIAEGKMGKTARALGFSFRESHYHQRAITAKFLCTKPHQGQARQLFTDFGPLGILPYDTHGISIVWSQDDARADWLLSLSDDAFLAELTAHIGDVTGALSWAAPRASFPLRHIEAARLTHERAVLVGDSAHVVHPLAGQGLNLGLRDVAVLLEILGDAKRLGLALGSQDQLAAYQNARRADIAKMTLLTKSIQRYARPEKMGMLLPMARALGQQRFKRVIESFLIDQSDHGHKIGRLAG